MSTILTTDELNKLVSKAEKFATRNNTEFVAIEVNKYCEVIVRVIDKNNKPKRIVFKRLDKDKHN